LAVELRLRKICRRLAQDLFGPAQFLHLAFENLQAIPVIGGQRRWAD
jgi:hypothetical protein